MINRLEFLIMFFGFAILAELQSNSMWIVLSIACGIIWCLYYLDDWNHRNDYEEDN